MAQFWAQFKDMIMGSEKRKYLFELRSRTMIRRALSVAQFAEKRKVTEEDIEYAYKIGLIDGGRLPDGTIVILETRKTFLWYPTWYWKYPPDKETRFKKLNLQKHHDNLYQQLKKDIKDGKVKL